MLCPLPFTAICDPPTCPEAWAGGVLSAPTWRLLGGGALLDAAGFHALVRTAGLPREELIHMIGEQEEGGGPFLLYANRSIIRRTPAEWLLGRIAWDFRHGQRGCVFDALLDAAEVRRLGAEVVKAWFA